MRFLQPKLLPTLMIPLSLLSTVSTHGQGFWDQDVAKFKNLIEFGEKECSKLGKTNTSGKVECVLSKFWDFSDVSRDSMLSVAEISRLLKMSAKTALSEESIELDKDRVTIALIALSPIFAKSIISNFDYDNDDLLSKDEVFYDFDFPMLAEMSADDLKDRAKDIYSDVTRQVPFLPSKKILSYEEQDNQEKYNLLELNKAKPLAAPIFLPLDTYIVNLKGGRRYLKTTIQLMLSEKLASGYLNSMIIEIKDIVLSELQDLTVEEVKKAESREALRQRLIKAISELLPSDPPWDDPKPIKKVLFEEFVLQ